ncbi:proline dehydrogenase [Hypoxylon texense]
MASKMTRSDRETWTPTREEYTQLWKESRLSIPPLMRIPAAAITAFSVGMTLGLAHGSKMAGLRFRAEHAHRLPTTTTGWYLYHKSKNYHLAYGGLKEGLKVGARLSVLSTAMFCVENLFDVYRGTKDLFSTVMASLAVAGGFSFWNRFSAAETARTAKKGLIFGLAYGAVQDVVSLAKGRPVGYVDFIRRQIGKSSQLQENTT